MIDKKHVFLGNKNEISSFGIWNQNEFISSSVSGECRIYDSRVKQTAVKCIFCGKSEDIERVFAIPLGNSEIQNKRQAIVVTNSKIMSYDLRSTQNANSIIITQPEKSLSFTSDSTNNISAEISCV